MKIFMEITDRDTNNPIRINVDHVEFIRTSDGQTVIAMSGGALLFPSESYDEITETIRGLLS